MILFYLRETPRLLRLTPRHNQDFVTQRNAEKTRSFAEKTIAS